VLFIAN